MAISDENKIIFNNGDFENISSNKFSGWIYEGNISTNLVLGDSSYGTDEYHTVSRACSLSCPAGPFTEGTLPPGIYQIIKVPASASEGDKITINLSFWMRELDLVDDSSALDTPISIYLYKLNSYSEGVDEIDYDKLITMENYSAGVSYWTHREFAVDIVVDDIGYYALGIGAKTFFDVCYQTSNVAIDNIEGYVSVWSSMKPEYPIQNGSFEDYTTHTNANTTFNGWLDSESTNSSDIIYCEAVSNTTTGYYYCPVDLGNNACKLGAHYNSPLSLGTKAGLGQYVYAPNDALVEISFWARCLISDASTRQYNIITEFSLDNPNIVMPYRRISQRVTSTWTHFHTTIKLGSADGGRSYFSITPPIINDSIAFSRNYSVVIDNVVVKIFRPEEGINTGLSIDEAYNENDGAIVYINSTLSSTGKLEAMFKPYNFSQTTVLDSNRFICIDGKYFMTKEPYLGTSGRYICYINEVIELGNGTYRCFLEDGRMAINESCCIGNYIYVANSEGIATRTEITGFVFSERFSTREIQFYNIKTNENVDVKVSFSWASSLKLDFSSTNNRVLEIVNIDYKTDYNIITIKGLENGWTILKAKYTFPNGKTVSGSIPIYINKQKVYNDITVNMADAELPSYMRVGNSIKLNATVSPMNRGLKLQWYSSNTSVASVDENGVVVAHRKGSAYINAYEICTGKSATHSIQVVEDIELPRSITLVNAPSSLKVGESTLIRYKVLNELGTGDLTPQEVIWDTDHPTRIHIDEAGVITALDVGNATIRCICATDSNVYYEYELNIEPSTTGSNLLKGITASIDYIAMSDSNSYQSEVIGLCYYPANTAKTGVVWTSSDPNIVEISQGGVVKPGPNAISLSSATVTYTSIYDSSITGSILVGFEKDLTLKPCIFVDAHTEVGNNEVIRIPYDITHGKDSFDVSNVGFSVAKQGGSSIDTYYEYYNEEHCIRLRTTPPPGTYVATLGYTYGISDVDRTFTFEVKDTSWSSIPDITEDLECVYNLPNNNTCIFRYYLPNPENVTLYHSIYREGEMLKELIPYECIYDGKPYYYVFVDGCYGTANYSIKISDGNINNFVTTRDVAITSNYFTTATKTILTREKQTYEQCESDLFDILTRILTSSDKNLSSDDRKEFNIRYRIYGYIYDNLVYVLQECIEAIDNNIKTAQVDIINLTSAISGNAIATQQEYTNSNFDNVTDMDYYQNELIKELVNKVLLLESKIQELENKLQETGE